jgi:hypothetical protein
MAGVRKELAQELGFTLACADVLVAVAWEPRAGLSHMPNVDKPHAVQRQWNCPLLPLRRQAHLRCNLGLRSNNGPHVFCSY